MRVNVMKCDKCGGAAAAARSDPTTMRRFCEACWAAMAGAIMRPKPPTEPVPSKTCSACERALTPGTTLTDGATCLHYCRQCWEAGWRRCAHCDIAVRKDDAVNHKKAGVSTLYCQGCWESEHGPQLDSEERGCADCGKIYGRDFYSWTRSMITGLGYCGVCWKIRSDKQLFAGAGISERDVAADLERAVEAMGVKPKPKPKGRTCGCGQHVVLSTEDPYAVHRAWLATWRPQLHETGPYLGWVIEAKGIGISAPKREVEVLVDVQHEDLV